MKHLTFLLLSGGLLATPAVAAPALAHDGAAHAPAAKSAAATAPAPKLQAALRGLLVAHGAHHAAQIAQVMRGDLAGEKTTWNAMQAHMDTIADAMAAALAKQFPDKAA